MVESAAQRAKRLLAPSAWQKELQRTVAISALDKVNQEGMMSVKGLRDRLYVLYHGDSRVVDSIGFVDHLLNGRCQFKELWDLEDIANTNLQQGTSETQVAPYTLVLKSSLSRDYQLRYVVGQQFTKHSLKNSSTSGNRLISGTTLLNMGKQTLRNWKKALAFGVEFLNPDGTLPSGTTEEDYDKHVLESMHKLLKGATTFADPGGVNDEEDDDENQADIFTDSNEPEHNRVAEGATADAATAGIAAPSNLAMEMHTLEDEAEMLVVPPEYFFQGWVSFKLFGHFAEPDTQSILMLTKDCQYNPGERASAGRAAARRLAAEERTNSRNSGITPDQEGVRGISTVVAKETAKVVANVAMTEDIVNSGIRGNSMFAVNARSTGIRERIGFLYKQIDRLPADSPKIAELEKKIDDFNEKLDTLDSDFDSLSGQNKRKREDLVDAFYVAVGAGPLTPLASQSAPRQQLTSVNRSNTNSPDDLPLTNGSNAFSPVAPLGAFSPVAQLPPANGSE
jgi:hypothetical protein